MDPVGIAASGSHQVEDEQMNILAQQFHYLVDELAEDGPVDKPPRRAVIRTDRRTSRRPEVAER
jgi:hypothetical protein